MSTELQKQELLELITEGIADLIQQSDIDNPFANERSRLRELRIFINASEAEDLSYFSLLQQIKEVTSQIN